MPACSWLTLDPVKGRLTSTRMQSVAARLMPFAATTVTGQTLFLGDDLGRAESTKQIEKLSVGLCVPTVLFGGLIEACGSEVQKSLSCRLRNIRDSASLESR
jgi:hypothetical protein